MRIEDAIARAIARKKVLARNERRNMDLQV